MSSLKLPEPKKVPKAKTKKRRLSPNTIHERETLENEKVRPS